MATIYIDGTAYEVDGADNLLQACLSLGLDVPYFCWHPALGSVGACRQCAVKLYKDADDKRGRIVMSCMTSATNNSYISIEDDEAKKFRAAIIEFLMLNHPHDCPVCEEGGNCHLQDMTVMAGHSTRRNRFNKKTHNNQNLGPFINHEMNRCIACYRCDRYYKDYAGGTDFGVYGAHDNIYFGRPEEGALESEFSGNLVEVCPTGVFTDKTHSARYNRKWDMQYAPSICQQCSVGCNISPGERYGELRRIENRYHGTINHYFLCDRGRFGYGYVNNKDRPRQPQLRQNGTHTVLDATQTTQHVMEIIQQANGVVAIGSARASIESNQALRILVGEENYHAGVNAAELARLDLMQKLMRESGAYTPSLREIETYDAILVLGEDVTQTGARIALAIRQALKGKSQEMAANQQVEGWHTLAIQNIGQRLNHPLYITHVDATRLDDVAAGCYYANADEQARLGFAIAHVLDKKSPTVMKNLPAKLKQHAKEIAQALSTAKKPLIVTGSGAGSLAVLQAAANIVMALKRKHQGSAVGVVCVAPEANSMGVAMLGGAPLDDALDRLIQGQADTLIVLENDLYRHALTPQVDQALSHVKNLIVIDHQNTRMMAQAQLAISSASFAEADGTLINNEGRAQRFYQVFDPAYYDQRPRDEANQLIAAEDSLEKQSIMLESWRWLGMMIASKRKSNAEFTLDQVLSAVASEMPHLAGILEAAPKASFRVEGMKQARQPSRYSGRTAIRAGISVHEQGQPQDQDSSLTFSMEGYSGSHFGRQQVPFAWAPGWNSPQAWNRFQEEVGGALRAGDSGKRLIEQADDATLPYFDLPQENPVPQGVWQVAPYYHLFGSEELSQRAEVIQERMPYAYMVLGTSDAKALGLSQDDQAMMRCEGVQFKLPVQISKHLKAGQVGLPLGLPGISPALLGKFIDDLRKVTA